MEWFFCSQAEVPPLTGVDLSAGGGGGGAYKLRFMVKFWFPVA